MALQTTPIAADNPLRQLDLLRFSEELQGVLARCSDECDVESAAVHRTVSAFYARAGCLALYDEVAGAFDVISHTRGRPEWPVPLFARALAEGRPVQVDADLAVPFTYGGQPRGVVALSRDEPFARHERQALRGIAARVGAELERRGDLALDDVLDTLLKKTKPIDVYTHAVRELRRFLPYDHSVAIMTATREMHRLIVRVEKVVATKGSTLTLVDSERVGQAIVLDPDQYHVLSGLDGPVHAVRYAGGAWRSMHGDDCSLGICGATTLGAQGEVAAEGSQLLWPLSFGGQMLGVLRVSALRPGAFDPLPVYTRTLERLARLLSVTIYRSDLYYQSERQLQAIKEMGRLTTHPLPVEQVCAHTLRLALRALHVEVGVVALLREDGALNVVAEQGGAADAPRALRDGLGITGMVAASGVAAAIPDVRKEPGYIIFNERVRSELCVPITYDDTEVIGVIDVQSFEERRFREEDEEVLSFLEALANQTAVAIKNSGLRAEAIERFGLRAAADTALTNADFYQRILAEDQHRRARQEVQQELSRRLMRSDRVQDILREVVSLSLDRAGGDGACLYLLEDSALTLKAHLARRGSHPRWLHEYAAGQEALDKAAASFSDAGADHAWVIRLPEQSVDGQVLPATDAVVAPLYGRSRTRGLLCVLRLASPRRPIPGQNETELLATAAGLAAVAIEKLRQREQMRALHAIDRAIGSGRGRGPGLVFAKVVEGIALTTPGDGSGYIALGQGVYDPVLPALYRRDRGLRVATAPYEREQVEAALRTVRHDGGHAPMRGGPKMRRLLRLPEEVNSALVAPISMGEHVRGVLVFWHNRLNAFTDEDEEWARALAAEAAIAIEAWQRATDLEKRTEQLRRANERLAAASRAKSEFLANMSHELRTPLNAVIGFSKLLLDPTVSETLSHEERQQSLEDIRDSGNHLLALINDILDLSKVEAGRMVLVPEDFSLVGMVESVRVVGESIAGQQNKHLHLHAEVVPPLDCVTADPGRLRQVLYNLVSNAVKFTPDGGAVTISAHEVENQIHCSVRDTGIGIAPEDQARIFEEFQQVDSAPSRQYAGTGLGLALVRKLVQVMGGEVWLESAPGQGSTFTFTIPK